MTPTDRIAIDASPWHPTLVFYLDRETRDCVALDRASGYFVGTYKASTAGISAVLIDAALRYEAPEPGRVS